jgi:hypothetical protein
MSYSPLRIQYPFDLSGVKFKSRSDILTMQRQWNMFESVENYNDIIYQRFSVGDRSKSYYQFRDRAELNDYRVGQILHINRYPNLPSGTFESISLRALPDVPVKIGPSNYTLLPPRDIPQTAAIPSSVKTTEDSDIAIYTHVSTFNSEHYFKYNFVSDEERIAYHRAERLVLTNTLLP